MTSRLPRACSGVMLPTAWMTPIAQAVRTVRSSLASSPAISRRHRLDQRADALADVGVVHGGRFARHEVHHRQVFDEQVQVRRKRCAGVGAFAVTAQPRDHVTHRVEQRSGQLEEQVLFGWVVVVDRRLGHADGFGDLPQ